jgi:hypothetical protein
MSVGPERVLFKISHCCYKQADTDALLVLKVSLQILQGGRVAYRGKYSNGIARKGDSDAECC